MPTLPTFAMLSHRGRIRKLNEDTCAARPDLGAFVLCDGMGGAAAGEVASQLAAQTFLDTLAAHSQDPPAQLTLAVEAANEAVFAQSQRTRSLRGMGTTLVAILLEETNSDATLWLAHVGDSRCYRLRADTLEPLTQDHSLVEEQVQAGILTRTEAVVSPIRNIITRAIGSQPTVEPEIAAHSTESGDLYLLASDGLTRDLSDPEIAQILIHAPSLEAACQALIAAANQSGGGDNITVILLACP